MKNQTLSTIRDVFTIWPDLHVMGAEIGQEAGTVKQWRTRKRIPEHAFAAIIEKAAAREVLLTWSQLAAVNAARSAAAAKKARSRRKR